MVSALLATPLDKELAAIRAAIEADGYACEPLDTRVTASRRSMSS